MKKLTLTTIGTLAAVLAFSTGCIHFNPGVVAEAKKSQEVAEHEMNDAQDQAETAYANLHRTKQELAQQKQRVGQLQRVHSLKMAEYEAFVAKTAQALAAKDKKISELSAPVK